MTWFLLLYFLVFSFVYVSPSVPCASQVIQPRPSIQPLVRAKHSATRPGQASDRLSRPSIPLARGIRLLVAAQHSTVCHSQASRRAFSHPSGLSIRPVVAAKHPARARHSATRRSQAFSRLSRPSILHVFLYFFFRPVILLTCALPFSGLSGDTPGFVPALLLSMPPLPR